MNALSQVEHRRLLKGLFWLGVVSSLLVLAAGLNGFAIFPESFTGPEADHARNIRNPYIWPRWSFPIPSPMLVLTVVALVAVWVARAMKSWIVVSSFVAVACIATILVTITFVHQSLTGPAWIRVPHWYWIWTAILGALCAAWYGYRIATGDRADGSQS